MDLDRPRRRADIVLRDLGPDAMLYDPVGDRVVRLNSTSRRIWQLCDGEHDLAAIAATIAGEFRTPPSADVPEDVAATVRAFGAAQLLARSQPRTQRV